MNAVRILRGTLVTLACGWMIMPAPLTAHEAVPAVVRDVQLQDGGVLAGQVLDSDGRTRGDQELLLQQHGRTLARATTSEDGRFLFAGLSGGTYVVALRSQSTACRCWAPHTAPPAAGQQLLLIDQGDLARGQRPFGEMITNPFVIGGLIVAALAIPIAIHNSDKDGS